MKPLSISCGVLTFLTAASAVVAPAQAQTAPATPVRLSRVCVTDPAVENLEAFSMLVPHGWKTSGGIYWDPTMQRLPLARQWYVLYDPAGADAIQIMPLDVFSYNAAYQQIGTPFGCVQDGFEFQPVMSPEQYVKNIVLPRYRNDVPAASVRVLGHRPMKELARSILAAEPLAKFAGARVRCAAGVVRIAYRQNNLDLEEDIYYALEYASDPAGTYTIWGPVFGSLYSFRALAGELDARTPMMQAVLASQQFGDSWWACITEINNQWFRSKLRDIRTAGEMIQRIARQNRELSDQQRQAWSDWSNSRSKQTDAWCDAISGVEKYNDPVTGGVTEIPQGYDNAWVNGRGEYFWSADPTVNPNAGDTIQWHKMSRRR